VQSSGPPWFCSENGEIPIPCSPPLLLRRQVTPASLVSKRRPSRAVIVAMRALVACTAADRPQRERQQRPPLAVHRQQHNASGPDGPARGRRGRRAGNEVGRHVGGCQCHVEPASVDRQIRPPGPNRTGPCRPAPPVTVAPGSRRPSSSRVSGVVGHGAHRVRCRHPGRGGVLRGGVHGGRRRCGLRGGWFCHDPRSRLGGGEPFGHLRRDGLGRHLLVRHRLPDQGWRRRVSQRPRGLPTLGRAGGLALFGNRGRLLARRPCSGPRQLSGRSRRLGHPRDLCAGHLTFRGDERPRGEDYRRHGRCRADGHQPPEPRARHPREPPGLGAATYSSSASGRSCDSTSSAS